MVEAVLIEGRAVVAITVHFHARMHEAEPLDRFLGLSFNAAIRERIHEHSQ